MGTLSVTVAPASEPVTTAEFKTHVHEDLSDASNDSLISSYITSARDWVETFLGRTLINTTLTYYMDRFPVDRIELPRPPISSITFILYRDTDGNSQSWGSSNYILNAINGQIACAPDVSFPDTQERMDAVSVTYVAGYGASASSVPDGIKTAIKMLAAHWYEHRTAIDEVGTATEMPMSVKSLLWPYRLKEFV